MGVKGLTTFIDENIKCCVQFVDLIQEAKRCKIDIIVDFYSWLADLVRIYFKTVCWYYGNEFLVIPGGDYLLLHRWIMKFVNDLKQCGINLIFYADGPLGASLSHKESKMPTMKARFDEQVRRMLLYVNICDQKASVDDIVDHLFPLLNDVQLFESLKAAGFEVHKLAFGEADYVLMQQFKARQGRAVLSSDSDFAVFQDCVWMPIKYFDRDNDLLLRPPSNMKTRWNNLFESARPEKLIVGIVQTTSVMQALNLSWEQLIDLSIIQGNDFTSPIIRGTYRLWRETLCIKSSNPQMRNPSVQDVANFIRSCPGGRLETSPRFQTFCNSVGNMITACDHSRKFYGLLLEATDARYQPGQITHSIEQVAPHLMGMHFGLYWHKTQVEDPWLLPIEIVLSDLRRFVYKILSGGHGLKVAEYGRSFRQSLDSATVWPSHMIYGMTFADRIQPQYVMRNLETIQRIMFHEENGRYRENLIRTYGWKNGFICVLLRFFLTLNWRRHLGIDEEEFMSLVAMIFGVPSLNLDFYYSLRILPSVRCVTIFNWFQDVYRHAYYFLGSVFRVTHELPQPKDCLSGSLFFAFFMIRHPQDVPALTVFDIERVRGERFQLIYQKRHIIKTLTVGHFAFDDNFR